MLELPEELRHLKQMHCEKQEWAAARFHVTEKGLLDRFNPRAQPPSQTSPAAEQHTQAESGFSEHEPSPATADVSVCKPLVPPPGVPDVMSKNATVSLEPVTPAPVQAPSSDLFKQMPCSIPLSAGRGRLFGKDSPVSSLPAIGRGFCLQISQPQTQGEPIGNRAVAPLGSGHEQHTKEVKPHHGPVPAANDPPVDASGLRSPQSPSFSLSQLLRPFK